MKNIPPFLFRRIRSCFTALVAFVVLHQAASAATVFDFRNSGSTAFADNFTQVSTGTFFTQQSGYVRGQQGTNFKGTVLYNGSPNVFREEVLTLKTAITGTQGTSPSAVLFSRVTDSNIGVAARVFFVSPTNIRLVLAYNVNVADQSTGTTLVDWEYSVSAGGLGFYRSADSTSGASGSTGNTLVSGGEYQLTLESTSDNQFKLSVYTSSGALLATTGFQTSVGLDAVVADQGKVGFGGVAANSAGNTVQFYEFSVIPEPGTVSLAVGAGALLLLCRGWRTRG